MCEFTQNDKELLAERIGKYSEIMSPTEAETRALAEIIQEKQAAKASLDASRIPHFEKIGGMKIKPTPWVIKGLLAEGDLAMVYGDSGTYKSFFALALSLCIAKGVDFYGLPIKKPGAVYYLAAEGSSGLLRRAMAWGQENGYSITDAPFYRYCGCVNLIEAADQLTVALENTTKTETAQPVLCVIDTLSRSLGGDDSSTTDSSLGLAAIDRIRARWPSLTILAVHHCGQSDKTRARGAYLWRAALDQEFRLEKIKGENAITLSHTKSKETEPLLPMNFALRQVTLLTDDGSPILNEDGEGETSAVLEKVQWETPALKVVMGKNQERILELLNGTDGVVFEELLKTCKTRFGMTRDTFQKAAESLIERNIVYRETGCLCLKKVGKI